LAVIGSDFSFSSFLQGQILKETDYVEVNKDTQASQSAGRMGQNVFKNSREDSRINTAKQKLMSLYQSTVKK
jgi:hypothetical protein